MHNERERLAGEEIVIALDGIYPKITTPLHHKSIFQLLIATILSAQCTDAQVNMVTPILFKRFPDAASMAKANLEQIEQIIKPTGFFRVKSRRIKDIALRIHRDYDDKVPDTMEGLTSFPGVGRKTANIVLSAGYGKTEGIAVDTHVKRLSRRLGLTKQKDPNKIEVDLMNITPREMWPRFSLTMILHGRQVCKARNPDCSLCVLAPKCKYYSDLRRHQ